MNIKKTLAIIGSVMILGAGLSLADNSLQKDNRNILQNKVKSNAPAGLLFLDENGDGICDFTRDHDNDGIPNRQDPDWSQPEDGSDYKNGNRSNPASSQTGNRNGLRSGNAWNNNSFRQNRYSFGNGVCDGSGPKRKGSRRGQNKR